MGGKLKEIFMKFKIVRTRKFVPRNDLRAAELVHDKPFNNIISR